MPLVTPRGLTEARIWTQRSISSASQWSDIAFGGDRFVSASGAVNPGIYSHSTDGISWTQASMPASGAYRVMYGDKFVAYRDGNTGGAYSTSGTAWTAMTLPVSGTWYRPAWGNGIYVCANYGGGTSNNSYARSTDGITWTARTTFPSSAKWIAVGYGTPGGTPTFVANCYGASTPAAYSTDDALTWSSATMPVAGNWYGIAYGAGVFVSISIGSANAASSTDGITWSLRTLPSSANWNNVVFANGVFMTLVFGTSAAAYSTDGITWTATTLPASANWQNAAFGVGRWAAVAESSATSATAQTPPGAPVVALASISRASAW